MLALVILAGLSIKLSIPSKYGIQFDFNIKGEMLMSIITIVTSCLAGNAGVCGGCIRY